MNHKPLVRANPFTLSALAIAINTASISICVAAPVLSSAPDGVSVSSDNLTITQGIPSATIEWSSFNIAETETVTFIQPDASSVTINNITDQNVSNIFGRIESNGQIFLSNPNGFLFGAGSSINTGSFLATTSNIALSINNDGSHVLTLDTPTNSGIIFEAGSEVNTNSGNSNNRNETFIAIFSPNISNAGTLTANNSSILLSDKNVGTINLYGLPDIGIDISGLEAAQMGVNLLEQSGNLSTGSGSYIALSNTELTTLIQSAINSPAELTTLTSDMFTEHLADYNVNIHGENLTLESGNPVFPQLNTERTLTFTATDELNILSTIQDPNLNLKLIAKNITIGKEDSINSLGGKNGLKSINITTSGTGLTDGLHLYSGMKAIDSININADITYHGNTSTDEIIFTTNGDTGNITFQGDFKASDKGTGDSLILESNTLMLSAIEGLGKIDFNANDIWLNGNLRAGTIKTTGGGNLYLMDNITLFSSDIDLRNISIASLIDNTSTQGYSLSMDAEEMQANFTLYNIQDNASIDGTNFTTINELTFRSDLNDSRLSLSGEFSADKFIIGGQSNGTFELNLSDDLTIKSLKTFDTQYAFTNGIYNFSVQGYLGDNINTNTAKLGKISDSTTLNSVEITHFNDISLYGDINVSSGDIALSAQNKIFINDSDVLNIGNNSNGKITLTGDIQTTDESGLKINTVNGHIEIDGISETDKLNSFTIIKTLASEGSVLINSDLYAATDITLNDLGNIEFSKDTTMSANTLHSTGSHLKSDFGLIIETNSESNLGQVTAKDISVIGIAATKSISNLHDDITAIDSVTFLNTDIVLQSNVSLTGHMNFLDAPVAGPDSELFINKPSINGNHDLSLNANNTDIHIYKFGDSTALRSLSINGVGDIVFDDNPIIDNLGNGSGGLSLLGDLNFNVGKDASFDTSDYDGYLDFSGATLNGTGSLTFDTGTGDLTLGTIGNNSSLESLVIKSTGKLNLEGDITLATPSYDFSSLSAVEIYKDMTFGSAESLAIVNFDDTTLDGTFSLTLFSDEITLGTIGSNKSLQDLTIHSGKELVLNNNITMVGTADINAAGLTLNNIFTNTGKDINLTTTSDITMSKEAVLIASNGDITMSSTAGNVSIASVNALNNVNIDAMAGSIFNSIDDYVSNASTSTNVSSENLHLNALNQIGSDVKSPIVIDILNGGSITAEANDGIYIANRNNASVNSRSLVIDSSTGGESAAIDAYSLFKLSSLNQTNAPAVTSNFGLINNLAWQTDEEESIKKIKTPNSVPPIYYSRRGWRLGY